MEARILEVMRERKQQFDEALEAQCISRVTKIRTAIQKYQQTLSPRDFCPQMEDVCQIPAVRKLIIDGTDRDFNAWAGKFSAVLPKLTSEIRDERVTKISALLPFKGQSGNILSLATAWFSCGLCCQYPIHGIDALGNRQCLVLPSNPFVKPIGEATIDLHTLGRGCCAETSEFTFSEVASTIAQGLILDCGEDPESITLAEINSKHHRFVFYENGELVAHSWTETVSTTA